MIDRALIIASVAVMTQLKTYAGQEAERAYPARWPFPVGFQNAQVLRLEDGATCRSIIVHTHPS
jgi:hypothetical protein